MHQSFVHFIPIFTTVFAVWFAIVLYRRYRERSTGPHLLWWSAGAALYAVGTFT